MLFTGLEDPFSGWLKGLGSICLKIGAVSFRYFLGFVGLLSFLFILPQRITEGNDAKDWQVGERGKDQVIPLVLSMSFCLICLLHLDLFL